MRISEHSSQIVKDTIKKVLSLGTEDPKRFLTEHDLQAWIFRELVADLGIGSSGSHMGIHCQPRFLDSEKLLLIEPDIAMFNLDEYTIGSDGSLTGRKGFTFWGASILVEIKLVRGCRSISLLDALFDIDKLSLIRELHYCDQDESYEYYPIFVLFSRPTLPADARRKLEKHAANKRVEILLADAHCCQT
jgi:hypothetical protein